MKGELKGGCLCGQVTYTIAEGLRLNPYACHCTDCQSRTGTAFSEHMLFTEKDIRISGELDIGDYVQPSGTHQKIYGCAKCKARIYAVSEARQGFASLRCGTLDNSAELEIAAHIWVKSKQPWIGLPETAKLMDEQPNATEEWVKFVGVASH